tara:strand:- start:618 stop:1124 length:507 start_codon:yes stop_codon:yes gene_type:complete
MFLSNNEFSDIVQKTPLISIDLCIMKGRKILVGKRINPPAKNFYFVPGGRIFKSEKKEIALTRILRNELGFLMRNNNYTCFQHLGIYEHFYEDNFLGTNDFNTHYVVLAYLIFYESLIKNKEQLVLEQHSNYIWHDIDNFKNFSYKIHPYTLAYFKHPFIRKKNYSEN